jgi:hypothetical protein
MELDKQIIMNSVEITIELNKIYAIHHSLDDQNEMTFVILLETNRTRFNAQQIQWVENMIDILHGKAQERIQQTLATIDVELAKRPILEKSSTYGSLLIDPQ